MSLRKLIIILVLVSATNNVGAFEKLTIGSESLFSNDIPDSVYVEGMTLENELFDLGLDVSITNFLKSSGVAYLLSENSLLVLNMGNEEPLSNWSLTRWPHELTEQTEYLYRTESAHNAIIKPEYSQFLDESRTYFGCLANTPLRYGKINNSGDDELVLTLANMGSQGDLIVFSPKYERIVFSLRFAEQDYIDSIESSEYQFVTESDYHAQQPAYRTFGKVFEGDFDGDAHSDLVVWRKGYGSNTKAEDAGFTLGANVFTHYERDLNAQAESEAGVTGEYLPQDTPEEDIQNWLAENNLTWSKGYPSKSECPGEEGQLIPEMHDPLLNEPDVLK